MYLHFLHPTPTILFPPPFPSTTLLLSYFLHPNLHPSPSTFLPVPCYLNPTFYTLLPSPYCLHLTPTTLLPTP